MTDPRPTTRPILALLLAAALLQFAAPESALADPPAGYEEPITWVGPVYFSWFRVDGRGRPVGQFYSPWAPAEGRGKWDGSVKFHKRHIRHIARAGFNMIFAVNIHGYEEQERNLFKAIRKRKEKGRPVPKVAPYFAAGSFECRECPKGLGGPRGRNEFYRVVRRWYRNFFRELEPEDLAFYDGKVLSGVWWVPGAETADNRFFERINDRLRADFGLEGFWSVNFTWEFADYDEVNWTFATLQGIKRNEEGNVTLQTGFWPPAIQPEENFLAREGGRTYRQAWDKALNWGKGGCGRAPRRITVISYNELTEGSGIYPAKCAHHKPGDRHWSGEPDFERCGDEPCHPFEKRDWWADRCNKPGTSKLYLHISRKKIRALERRQLQSLMPCMP